MGPGRIWHVTSFYRFVSLSGEELAGYQARTRDWMLGNGVLGLVLFAPEGLNGTVASDEAGISAFKEFLKDLLPSVDLRFKDSVSDVRAFHRVTVDLRKEIVGLKRPDIVPETDNENHLSPREWHEAMASDSPKVVIDTRNHYEMMVGKFKGAVDPNLKTFSDWSNYLSEADLPANVPVYLYCTGGIRCEKAILEMRSRGFEEVYQLRDGILGYLAEFPNEYFEGDCFVFDERVALDQQLQPSRNFGICPGCGLPASKKLVCAQCDRPYFICADCEGAREPVCSKHCQDLVRRHGLKPAFLNKLS